MSAPANFHRAIFEAAGDALAVLEAETGKILEVNQKMAEMFGFSREEARGLEFWALDGGSPGGAEGACQLVRQAAAGEPQLFGWQVQDSSGLRFWTEVHLSTLDLDGQARLVAVIREITGRQQVRQALEESEARFRTVTEGSLAGVFIFQGERLVYVNPTLAQTFGYRAEEMTELSVFEDLVQPPDRALVADNFRRLLAGELAWARQTLRGRRRDGSTILCEILGRRVEYQGQPAVIGTLLDITARQQMEQALRESEKRYRAIVEDQTELVTRFLPDGTITFVNEANCRYFGKSPADLLGKSFLPFIPEEDRARVEKEIFSLTPENPTATVEHRVLKPDGEVGWQQWTNRAIFDDQGQLREFQAVGRDITARKTMEEALRETRDHLQTLIQASPLAIIALDRDLRVHMWNPAAERIFGWRAAEVLGSLLPTIPSEEWPEAAAPLQQEMKGEQQAALELRRLRKDGSLVDVNLWTAPLKDASGEIIGAMGIFADITERRRAEAALRESEEKYRALLDNASDAILLADASGAIVEANKKAEELLGYSKEELLQFHYRKLYPARELARVNRKFREALEKGGAGPLNDTLVLRKDGKEVPVDITGCTIEYAGKKVGQGILRDITERKKAEAALRESEEKYRALMDHASDAIFLADGQGAILEANKKAEELLGYSKEELLKFHYTQLHPAKELDRVTHKFGELIEKGGTSAHGAMVLRKDSKEVPVEITGRVIEYGGKKVAQGIFRDITERKRAEEALRKSEQKLRSLASQLLSAQERERRRVSHELHDELGQALSAVKIHLVGVHDRLKPEQQALREECEHLLAHIDNIIENVRRLSWDLSPSILEDLGLVSALGYLVDETCRSHNMAWTMEMDDINQLFSPEVESNIYRIFQEALTNIVKHSRATRVDVAISRQEDGVTFTVADDGLGFDVKETLSRRASRKRLGLTTMRERARMAGGTMTMRSVKGRGTKITLVLPVK